MARRSRRDVPDPEDYLPEEDEFEDEEEEERPRRRKKRSRAEEDDEDEAPRRKRRSSRSSRDDDDDDSDDEPPRRKRRSTRDEDDDDSDDDESEDEAPPRRKKKRSRDEDDEVPRRRKKRSRDDEDDDDSDDDDSEDEPPRRGKKKSKSKGKKKRGSNRNAGWGGYQTVKSKSSNYADKLQVGKIADEVLVKFLDDAPFDSYGLHWFDEMSGKKGWMCLVSVGEEKCPGCDMGDRPMAKALFNAIVFDEDGDPVVKVIDAGTRLAGQLEKLSSSTKGGLTRDYWSITAGPKGSGTGNFQRVKERDLEEDWELEPLTDEELDEFEEDRHVLSDVEQIPSYKDFREAVRDIEE